MVHIIGAGISGLAAATQLADAHVPVTLYEATANAGGRARSSTDATLGVMDHGLHLIRGDSDALFAYLSRISARDRLREIDSPIELPAAPIADYIEAWRSLSQSHGLAEAGIGEDNHLRDGVLSRLSRVLLHTELPQLAAVSSRAELRSQMRRQKWLVPEISLNDSFITPALEYLEYTGAAVYYGHALNGLQRSGDAVSGLNFARKKVALNEDDVLIFATPSAVTQAMLPMVRVSGEAHASITIHYACAHREPVGSYALAGDAVFDVVRYGEERISVMIRVADGQWSSEAELLAHRCWRQLQAMHPYLKREAMPDYAIWREKRAGHVLTPDRTVTLDGLPPRVLVAGDWLSSHAPATLNAAAKSGHDAADAALALLPRKRSREQSAATRFIRN